MFVKIPYETAEEKGVNLELEIPGKNLLKIYIPEEPEPVAWPEFREYALQKYANELDEDVVTMIEDLIDRRRAKNYGKRK